MSLKILYIRDSAGDGGTFVAIDRMQEFRAVRVREDQLREFVAKGLEFFKQYAVRALKQDRASVLLTDDKEFSSWAQNDLGFGLRPFIYLDQPHADLMADFATSKKWISQQADHSERNHLPEYSSAAQQLEWIARFGDFCVIKAQGPFAERALSEFRRKKKILLHVCCGPDAAGVIHQLKADYELVCFWYDPNIQPKEEHDKRLEAFLKVVRIESTHAIIGEYDEPRFAKAIEGLEHTPEQGAKCSICYDLRLERAAREAKAQNCDLYTTTLAISPHKVQQKLAAFGRLYEQRLGIPYLARNFLKGDGFKRSVELTREHSIYRQDYCGCYSSMTEGGPDARSRIGK
jgi:epoxyqueuosine reductase